MNQAKQRILLAVTLAEQGGVQEFLLRFATHLRAHGHDVIIVAGEGDWLFQTCHVQGIPIRRLTHMRRALHPWHDLCAIFEMRRLLKELHPNAIHLNSSKMGAIGSLAAHLAHRANIVYRIGGWVFLEPLSPITRWLYKSIEKISARWKDIIICVHPCDEEVARVNGIRPRQTLLTIPNGIDFPHFTAQLLDRKTARQKLHVQKDVFVFGTIANLFPAKDLPRYLEACALVHAQHPQTRFIVIGEGEVRSALEKKRAELGLASVLDLPGALANASQYLLAFDAFVLPSAKEGMSWALIEAMAASLPCIATDVGAHRWLLDHDAGWIVPAQDPQVLAQSMAACLQDQEEAHRRGSNAKARIKKDFPLQKTLQENERTLID